MKRLSWVISCIAFFSLTTFAQGDHNDLIPVQSGYAVVTPATPSLTGLRVSETFGWESGSGTLQSGMAAPPLGTSVTMFVNISERLGRDVGIAIANPNASLANVNLLLQKDDGTTLGTKSFTLNGRRQLSEFLTELFPVFTPGGGFGGPGGEITEYAGSLTITSDQPLSIVGVRFRNGNFSILPATSSGAPPNPPTLSLGVGGAGSSILPQFAVGAGWETQVIVLNTSGTSATVRLDLFAQDGTPFTVRLNGQQASSFTNLTIPAGGVLILSPRDTGGDDRF
jgi:hypothetical protein